MSQNKILEWAKTHKTATAVFLFFIFIILIILASLAINLSQIITKKSGYDYYPSETMEYSVSEPLGYEPSPFFDKGFLGLGDYSEEIARDSMLGSGQLEIREGRINVKSEDAEKDFEVLKNIVDEKNGYIEESKKIERNTFLIINAKTRMPIEEFESFIEKIKETFEVEDFELKNYRIDIQRQTDEISIIKQAIEDYNSIREETLNMKPGEERIKLLSMITNEMQYLARQLSQLERSLGGKEEQADLATVNFTFSQTLKAKLWPEELSNRFRDRINWALDSIITTFMFLIANVLVLFVKIIEYIIYIIVIAVPIIFAWKLIKKLKHLVK